MIDVSITSRFKVEELLRVSQKIYKFKNYIFEKLNKPGVAYPIANRARNMVVKETYSQLHKKTGMLGLAWGVFYEQGGPNIFRIGTAFDDEQARKGKDYASTHYYKGGSRELTIKAKNVDNLTIPLYNGPAFNKTGPNKTAKDFPGIEVIYFKKLRASYLGYREKGQRPRLIFRLKPEVKVEKRVNLITLRAKALAMMKNEMLRLAAQAAYYGKT
jgi:hypothetical protein